MWTYVAWVRTSGILTYYINGKAAGTVVDAFNYSLGSTTVNIATSNNNIGSYDLNGNMSNLRVVKGTAVYSANFTPPTSNLTAITNTSLLTLQNATIIDNSTNAWSITNTGSVAMTSGTVGTYSLIANDASPNGNNWTPNNINAITVGTTYDAMLDVPTNTSATVANYAVLNPLDTGANTTISDGNLKYVTSSSGGVGTCRGTFGVTSGKWYFEITAGSTANANTVGIANANMNVTTGLGDNANGWGYSNDGYVYNNGSGTNTSATWGSGDIAGIAFDADSGKLWFAKNNTWVLSGNPSAGTSPTFTGLTGNTFFPAVSDYGGGSTSNLVANFGQRPFSYTPPTGFVALNTFNLPTPTILQGNKYMDATLWTGTGTNLNVVNASQFKPDFVWIKNRSTTNYHNLFDSVRGVQKALYSNTTDAEATETQGLLAFNSNGFNIGTNGGTNGSGNALVGWQWQAGQGTTSSNTSGSITSTVSVNATAGFSVLTWTGNGSAGATIGHSLGVAPKWIIVKRRNSSGDDWLHYHTSLGATKSIAFDTAAAITSSTRWNNTEPSSTLITLGTSTGVNGSGATYVAYCWAEIAGFSKFGSYTGNGSADGPFMFTGFRPKWIMVKNTAIASNWLMYDTSRDTYNVTENTLIANSSGADAIYADVKLDILSNGFKIRQTSTNLNGNGNTLIYMAFAENPFKNANAR
jgi:hypothetical protein